MNKKRCFLIFAFLMVTCTTGLSTSSETVRLSVIEIEKAFGRLQSLTLPMPAKDAWAAIGLPKEEQLELIISGGGSIRIYRCVLTDSSPDGSYYTFSMIYSFPKDKGKPIMLLKACFAIEHIEQDRPALVLAKHNFIFEEYSQTNTEN